MNAAQSLAPLLWLLWVKSELLVAVEDLASPSRISDETCGDLTRLEALPGRGWDILRDQDMGQVFQLSYSECKTTLDRRYLIPNNVEAVPVRSSQLETSSDVMTHWNNYNSLTSDGTNFNLGLDLTEWDIPVKIGPSFSKGYKQAKQTMTKQHATLVRTHIRYVTYGIHTSPSSPLHPELEHVLQRAMNALEANNTDKAEVLLEFVVRDYGTHYVKQSDAGAILLSEDYVADDWLHSQHIHSNHLKAAGEIKFLEIVKLNLEISNHKADMTFVRNYKKHIKKQSVHTIGGPRFELGMTVEDWSSKVDDNMVNVEKSTELISHLITPARFPRADPKLLQKLRQMLEMIVRDYIAYNIHAGCMNPESPNFDYNANVEGPCNEIAVPDHKFGGVYTYCMNMYTNGGDICASSTYKNPLTGLTSCPSGYNAVLLHEELKERTTSDYDCKEHCSGWWIFKKCRTDCELVYHYSSARIKTYWCSPSEQTQPENGYLFGGVYSTQVSNVLTGGHSCPLKYTALRLTSSSWVCVAASNSFNARSSMEFGGFFSCSNGNSLRMKTQDERSSGKSCPPGYQQHMATIENHCQINYCAKFSPNSKEYKDVAIIRPPFKDVPSRLFQPDPSSMTTTSSNIDKGTIAGIVLLICVICVILTTAFYIYFKHYRRQRQPVLTTTPNNRHVFAKNSTINNRWGNLVSELQLNRINTHTTEHHEC